MNIPRPWQLARFLDRCTGRESGDLRMSEMMRQNAEYRRVVPIGNALRQPVGRPRLT